MGGEDGSYANISMSGQDVFKWAVRAVPAVVTQSLEQANLSVEDIDWLVLHQANKRILAAAGDRLKIPSQKIISNISQYGNTSAQVFRLPWMRLLKRVKSNREM